jgi:hypothetical protein
MAMETPSSSRRVLGDLELETVRLQPRLGQHPAYDGHHVLGLELRRRKLTASVVSTGQVVA